MKILWSALLHRATINRPNWSTHEKTTYESDALLRDRTPLWNPGWLRNCHRTSFTTRRSSSSLPDELQQSSTPGDLSLSPPVEYDCRFHYATTSIVATNDTKLLHSPMRVCLHTSVIQICPPLRPVKLLTSHCDPKLGQVKPHSTNQSHTFLKHSTCIIQILFDWCLPVSFKQANPDSHVRPTLLLIWLSVIPINITRRINGSPQSRDAGTALMAVGASSAVPSSVDGN